MSRAWIVAVVLAVLAVLFVVSLAVRSARATRPPGLGILAGHLGGCPASPNCVSSQAPAEDPGHHIEPIRFRGDPIAALDRARTILEAMPRTVIVTAADDYVHAECTSRLFRFVDDVELRVDGEAGHLEVRSASRTGHSDLGVNRKRVEALREGMGKR